MILVTIAEKVGSEIARLLAAHNEPDTRVAGSFTIKLPGLADGRSVQSSEAPYSCGILSTSAPWKVAFGGAG